MVHHDGSSPYKDACITLRQQILWYTWGGGTLSAKWATQEPRTQSCWQAGLLGLLLLSPHPFPWSHLFCLPCTLLLGISFPHPPLMSSAVHLLISCSHRSQAGSSRRGEDRMERGGKTSRRKNKPTEPQLFMHLSHVSVSPVSTLVWLARGLAASLPTLVPAMAQDQKCFLLAPLSPGRTHCIWKRTIHL